MQNNITGKVIVITGASSDLSEAIPLFLASQYAKIVLAALHAERMNAFAKDLVANFICNISSSNSNTRMKTHHGISIKSFAGFIYRWLIRINKMFSLPCLSGVTRVAKG
ncbi:hypothetical protein AIQ76_23075 [Salmonella enterica]|uniref:Uncharacterized protein n=1 Tax=Salmonella enterica TaxID=28901 RepID=A0A5U2KLU2_SALER|nr:hypothetical protein [Salmonella enterica]EBP3896323.1 hypothetical protein [Salmonella enterica subsp. enterica]EKB3222614.1 hypothetical protein [Salmonella enterica subsp. enterica serovar Gaminara]EAM3156693.1 hypothetical protein [Salmonella enterica]EAM8498298.1 hypothetical protein [Salmonella enterica]